jgi:pilus assembly protein CpaE
MWSAAIAGADASRAAQLRACLQQTGLIGSVTEWDIRSPADREWERRVSATDVVLLTLNGNPGLELGFAADLRRANPSVRIIAYALGKQPDSELLLHAMRSGVQEVLPSPLNATLLQEALTRFHQADTAGATKSAQKLILVMGSKGGVGTSTIAINLAVQLVQLTQKRVALLDFARPIGHAALMLDLQSKFTLRDAAESLDRLDSHFLGGLLTRHKTGVEVLAGLTQPEEWHQVSALALPGVVNVAQSSFDYVVMDYGSVYSLEFLSAVVLRMARTILLVAESNVPSLWTLERHIAGLTAVGLDSGQIRVVINRWTREDDDALKSLEKKLKRPVFARLPNDFRQVSEAVNLGTPLNRNHSNPLVSQLRKLAVQLGAAAVAAPPKKESFGGLFSFKKKG